MLICLEGSDYAGKTTLANEICAAYAPYGGTEIIHTGPPPDPHASPFQDYEKPFDDDKELRAKVLSDNFLVVLDRWSAGDRIYGPRYRGFARFTDGGELHTEMALSSVGAVKVLCSPPLNVLLERVKLRGGDDYVDTDDLPRIHAEYLSYGTRYGYYFFGLQDYDAVIPHFIKTAQYDVRRARQLAEASDGTYTGSLYPQVIFAGDELGGTDEDVKRRGGYTRPFTPISPVTSGEWLMDAIYKAGFLTTSAIVNVNHPGVNAGDIASLSPDSCWVALGARASTTLNAYSIPHHQVNHPQFERRFRHNAHDAYVTSLKHAANGSYAANVKNAVTK